MVWVTRRRISLGVVTVAVVATVIVVVVLTSGGSTPASVAMIHPRWQVQAAPAPVRTRADANGSVVLRSVSCPVAGWCMAVGAYQYLQGTKIDASPVLAVDSDDHWRVLRTPAVHRASNTQLYGVSCGSVSMCMAVGESGSSTGVASRFGVPYALLWNGHTVRASLTATSASTVTGGDISSLDAVSCPTASDCMAVGVTGQVLPLAEHWDGRRWSSAQLPIPRGSSAGMTPAALSCPTARDCMMVANRDSDVIPTGPPVLERWNGAGWRNIAGPRASRDGELEAISCPSERLCTVAGQSNLGSAVIARWTPSGWDDGYSLPRWGSVRFPSEYYFAGLSCAAGSCTAVGAFGPFVTSPRWPGVMFAEDTPTDRWFGMSASGTAAGWRGGEIAQPGLAGAAGQPSMIGALDSVSCSGSNQCVAVGTARVRVTVNAAKRGGLSGVLGRPVILSRGS